MNELDLVKANPHESPNQLSISLKQSFTLCQSQLKPPFSLKILSPIEYQSLNFALIYGMLTNPSFAKIHTTHLHSIVIDGYKLFATTLVELVNDSYQRLLGIPRLQLIWVVEQLVKVSAVKVDVLLLSLMRQVLSGDFSENSLWLCGKMIEIFMNNWTWLITEQSLVFTSAVYMFLRLLSDHHRLVGSVSLDLLKKMEVEFCVKAIRECFGLCMDIGRDLIRLLQDLVYIPEFRELWKDLLFEPKKFGVSNFTDISQLYCTRTPSHYFVLRISRDMEMQLRFLLMNVKWGNQRRYQAWFARKYLSLPCNETLIIDIVRFVCCAHHPSNEIIQSNVISRWAVIGWLLKLCKKNYFEANVKLALFYDWLFFDNNVDNIMNIEPAMLLMVNSLPKYVDMTQTLLEFLFLLVDNYDVHRKALIVKGVSDSFDLLMKKGVIHSLDVVTSCSLISPSLRERLKTFNSPSLREGLKTFNSPSYSTTTLVKCSFDIGGH